jgi:hypothetical protein
MSKLKAVLIFLILLIIKSVSCQEFPKGSLVIVGGGLYSDNKSIFSQLIEFSGGAGKAVFSVIPSASGVATLTCVYFRSELISQNGISPNKDISLSNIFWGINEGVS